MFVANRIQRIKSSLKPEQWAYVVSEDNPADYASRGLTAEQLCPSPDSQDNKCKQAGFARVQTVGALFTIDFIYLVVCAPAVDQLCAASPMQPVRLNPPATTLSPS